MPDVLNLNGSILLGDFSKQVEFSLPLDETLILSGPNGAGKTTLLKSIIGILPLASGELTIGDTPLDQPLTKTFLAPEQRNMAMVFSEPRLFGFMNLVKNASFGMRYQKSGHTPTKAEIIARTKELLNELGLGNLLGRSPKEISAGQAQRVAIARALLIEPEILLLDELFTGLDAESTELISELLKKNNSCKILATHNRRLAEKIAMRPNYLELS